MVQEERQNRDLSAKASHINFLKSIETVRNSEDGWDIPQNMLWISPEKSYFIIFLMLSNV